MAHRVGRSRVPARSARQTSWVSGPSGNLPISSVGTNLFATGLQATDSGLTLVRSRGELVLQMISAAAGLDGFSRIAAGLCIVSENAFNAGAGSIPDPLVDIAWDGWLWFWTGSLFSVFNKAITDDEGSASSGIRIEIDSKAMRKFKNSDVCCAVLSNQNEVGTAVYEAKISARLLVKLA